MKAYWFVFVLLIVSTLFYSFVFETGFYYLTSMIEIPAYMFYTQLFGYSFFVGIFLSSLEKDNEKHS